MKKPSAYHLVPRSERGIALAIALIAALVISLTAIVVINLSAQRFHSAHWYREHAVALSASEGGVQYAWKRLEVDSVFKANVIAKAPGTYVVRSDTTKSADEYDSALQMNGKEVVVQIQYDSTRSPNAFQIDAQSSYGP